MSGTAAGMLIILFFAHFLGDFTPLATPGMQKAKALGRPVGPIAAHAAVHALLVGIAVWVGAWPGVALAGGVMGIEFVTHLAIDWARGRLGANRPALSDPEAQAFWTILGLDQLAHGLVMIWIAFLVL